MKQLYHCLKVQIMKRATHPPRWKMACLNTNPANLQVAGRLDRLFRHKMKELVYKPFLNLMRL